MGALRALLGLALTRVRVLTNREERHLSCPVRRYDDRHLTWEQGQGSDFRLSFLWLVWLAVVALWRVLRGRRLQDNGLEVRGISD